MDKQQAFLARACEELGLKIWIGRDIEISPGSHVKTIAHIENLGAPLGTLVFSYLGDIRVKTKDLIDAGYSYSVYLPPFPAADFDISSYIEMFSDWGWAGAEGAKPNWMP